MIGTTRACHFDQHHRHTTTINGEAVSDHGAYLHAQQAEADDRAMPDILTKAPAKPRVPRWARNNPTALASLERARQRRIERAERTAIVVPKGSTMKYGRVPTRKSIDHVR